MNQLIGKKFKRNKYGLSLWTKTINSVAFDHCWDKIEDEYYFKLVPRVAEEINPPYQWYYLDEIVFIPTEINDRLFNKLEKFLKIETKWDS